VAIADSDEHCAFHLVDAGWAEPPYEAADRACETLGASARTITLHPGETYPVDIDLSQPRWHILQDGKSLEVGALPEFATCRVEYQAPKGVAAVPGLWKGRLRTRRFNANGFID
jgi:hypothetical protein